MSAALASIFRVDSISTCHALRAGMKVLCSDIEMKILSSDIEMNILSSDIDINMLFRYRNEYTLSKNILFNNGYAFFLFRGVDQNVPCGRK